jgi:hypothetical protein
LTWSIRVFPCGFNETISGGTRLWTVGTITELDANATVPNEPFFFKDYLAENWVVDPVLMRSIGNFTMVVKKRSDCGTIFWCNTYVALSFLNY